jgi:hypothetical protein
MARKEFEISRHVLVLALTALVFLSGIAIGSLLNRQQVSTLEEDISALKASTDGIEAQGLMLEVLGPEKACPVLRQQLDVFGKQADELAGRLTEYEESRKFGESFKTLKEEYTALLVREWLFARKAISACGSASTRSGEAQANTILYLYTNKNCPACTNEGVVLDVEKRKRGQELLVFPIDTDLGLPVVNGLIEAYNVTEYPFLVIDSEAVQGFVSFDSLEARLAG